MQVHLCGVRGSTPAPGAEFVRFGGHTSCVALSRDGAPPSLILDAGTGLRNVTRLLGAEPFRGTILLGHLHWDHVHGLPFFTAGQRLGSRVDVFLPAPGDDPVEVLARGMSPPHFPIGPRDLGEGWNFGRLEEGRFEFEGFEVLVREIPHKGGQTFGFRVDDGTTTIAYLSDHDPLKAGLGPDEVGDYHAAALELADGVDLLIHDAQFLKAEFPAVGHLGHSAVEYAIGLAEKAGVEQLMLYHHSPNRTDDEIDAILTQLQSVRTQVLAAVECTAVGLPARGGRP
jgi:phosphoribosyl 1,2-cyclic phosphodiesterase